MDDFIYLVIRKSLDLLSLKCITLSLFSLGVAISLPLLKDDELAPVSYLVLQSTRLEWTIGR